MKYETEIKINASREKVVDLFQDLSIQQEWQKNLKEIKPLKGSDRKAGDINDLIFDTGDRVIEMRETVLDNKLPDKFNVLYEANGIQNIMMNTFTQVDEDNTVWHSEVEFKFKGFMKLATLIMKPAFKRQTIDTMTQFKKFAEHIK